jgi:dihydrofolate reductase
MAKLIYGMITSLDGYTEDERGDFGWATPSDETLHAYINELHASVGTYLYGRRMYETMVFWETALLQPEHPEVVVAWAKQWLAADKIVYSRSLTEVRSARTRIEREFEVAEIRRLKETSEQDITVNGPALAAHAIYSGLVDEIQVITSPVIVGGGKRFLPGGLRIDLELLEQHRFSGGVVALRYAVQKA